MKIKFLIAAVALSVTGISPALAVWPYDGLNTYGGIGLYGSIWNSSPVIGNTFFQRQFLISLASQQLNRSWSASSSYLGLIPGNLYGIPCIQGLTC